MQAQWLQAQLAASTSAWQIVYMHQPPYSAAFHGPTLEMQWPFETWGADAVLAGHDHDYERLQKGGIPYFVVGSGGSGLYGQSPSPDPDSLFFYNADHGTLIVDACDTRLSFEFHSVSEGVVDSYSVGAETCSTVNDPPVASDDSASTSEDVSVNVVVLANDSDVDDPTLTVTDLGQPFNGAAVIETDNTVTYTPDADYNGGDSFTYTANDGTTNSNTATVTIAITAVNDPPRASDDTASASEDNAVNIDVLANDSDVDGSLDASSLQVAMAPSNGSTQVETDSTVTYTPDADYNGGDSFVYRICDTGGLCDTATVTITAVNDPPQASDDTATTTEDTPVNVAVLANDSDVDDPVLTVTNLVQPVNGMVVVEVDNTVTYTPNLDYFGSDTFTYTANDGSNDSNTATVTITAVNDPPQASDDTATTTENTQVSIDVLANDADVDGNLDPPSLQVTMAPSNGSTQVETDDTITYTPDTGYTGTDTFTYQACDLDGLCDTATVTITVQTGTVEQFAQSEETVDGSVSGGSLTEPYSSDGVFEELTEKRSGGPAQSRQSFLDHRWSLFIERGDSIDVVVEAFHSPNAEGDDIAVEYSVDGGATFTPLFVVAATDIPTAYSATLPPGTSGDVLIRVVDTDQTLGNGSTDTVFVNLLVIRTTNPLPPQPEVTVTASDGTASETGDTGTFTVHRDDSSGSLTVSYTVAGTATDGSDYEMLAGSVSLIDGQADALITVTPIVDSDTEGDESVELNLVPGVDYSLGTPSSATLIIVDDDTVGSESRAVSEDSVYGSVVAGNYQSTHFADGVFEVIEEELYAGNKRSRPEHQWAFDVATGSTVTFFLLADQIGSEGFTFSYSTDGSSWTDMSVSASGAQESFVLPAGTQGTVSVRVVDDNRSRNEITIDTIRIDEMYFHSSP